MTTYTVLSPRAADLLDETAAERAVFVPERFSWATLLLTPLVLLRFRLWLALLAYVAVAVLMQVTVQMLHVPEMVAVVVMAGFSLLLAFELPRLRAAKLLRKGSLDRGVVIARNRTEAERRYFTSLLRDDMLAAEPLPRRPGPPASGGGRSEPGFSAGDRPARDPAADDLASGEPASADLPSGHLPGHLPPPVSPVRREPFPGAAPQPTVIGSFPGGTP